MYTANNLIYHSKVINSMDNGEQLIKRLDDAQAAFSRLEKCCSGNGNIARAPKYYDAHFLTAYYAASLMDSQIFKSLTKLIVGKYLSGEREFTKNNYQDLADICESARNLSLLMYE